MFTLSAVHRSGARRGLLQTAHGQVLTPAFMPIATKGAVKTLAANEVAEIEQVADPATAPILLSNTYHLYLKPGLDLLRAAGGLHEFMHWPHAILTDSGGFQVFSLAHLRTLTDDGVEFNSHLDGSRHLFTPEKSMEIQSVIGADIWMAFDYFPGYPATEAETERSVALTTAWAKRCREWFLEFTAGGEAGRHQLFGIVQGSTFAHLRQRSAAELLEIGFDGYAIGGLAVGEPAEELYRVLEVTAPLLPSDQPRYLMGVGPPEQILEAVKRGVDLFDCVIPTRNARHGTAFVHKPEHDHLVENDLSEVRYDKLNVAADKWSQDLAVLDPYCQCPACAGGINRAYLRHLFTVDEPLAARLLTGHNIAFYMRLMAEIRAAIA